MESIYLVSGLLHINMAIVKVMFRDFDGEQDKKDMSLLW